LNFFSNFDPVEGFDCLQPLKKNAKYSSALLLGLLAVNILEY